MVASSNHKEAENLILARFEPKFLEELMKMWPDKERGKRGISQAYLAQKCEIAPRSIAYYLSGERQPDRESLEALGRFFGLHFVVDWDNSIDMDKLLERLRALNSPI